MLNGQHETHTHGDPRELRARPCAARGIAGDARRSWRDPAHDQSRDSSQLPSQPLPGRQPHDRLSGQGRRQLQPRERAPRGHDRRLDDQLGKPNATQVKFFNANEGGASEAGIAILRAQKKPNLTYKLIAQSPPVKLQSYFGKTAQFPLERTIAVKKGDIVALTVPTWAPALALGFGKDTSWRASRSKSQCASTSAQSTQTAIGSAVQYFCLYQTARLTYSATLISTP